MAKYTSDTNLIRGAAAAYRNYDNAAGIYSGLDKVTQAGMGVVDEAVKGYEAEQEKIKKEQEEAKKEQEAAKAKQDAIEKSWNNSADQVLLNAGSLGDNLYNSTSDEVQELKKLYLEGVNEKDDKKRLSAMRQLQAHSTWIQDHKQMNIDYAAAKKEGKLSNWYNSKAGSEEAHTVDQIMGQKYTKTSRGEDGDVIFHIKDSKGDEKLVPSKEYNNMIMPKNFTVTANTAKLQVNVNKSEILEEDMVRQSIGNSLPNNERDFLAAMHDDVSGKNLKTMLETSNTLDNEILSSIDVNTLATSGDWNLTKAEGGDDNPLTLTEAEKVNFIDAVTNPENDFFKLETSKQIMADQIFNGVKNSHKKHWGKINAKNNKNNTTPTGTGFLATANTKKPRGVSSGTLGRSFGYNVSKNMYDQFKLSSEGKPAEFSIGKTYYNYDVENNNWIQTTGDGTKKDLGDLNATLGPKGFAIVDPDFMALRTTAAEITEDSDVDFDITDTKLTKSQEAGTASVFEPKINMTFVNDDDNVVAAQLQNMMPTAFDVEKNPLGYKFMNLKRVGAFSGEIEAMGDFTKEAVGLYSDDGKTHITYPVGHEKDVDKNGNPGEGKIPVIIYLGSDEATRKEAIATIDNILNTPEFKISGFKSKLK